MGCAATARRSARSCPMCDTGPAATSTIVPRTRIGRPGVGSGRCSVSSHPGRHSGSCRRTA
jgi:hypothetical protein